MIKAILDPQFQPMVEVVNSYKKAVAEAGGVPLTIAVQRNKGYISTYSLDVYADGTGHDEENYGIASAAADTAASIQEKTAFLPDYAFANSDSAAGTSVSGIAGSAIVAGVALLVCLGGGFFRKKKAAARA